MRDQIGATDSFEAEDEISIDSFAGGGGTSEGIKEATGRDPDIAINHDRYALAMHRINHPGTLHLVEDVVLVDAISMCGGRPIGFIWMSPDCKDHSKAKGGQPRDKNIRGLAWACFSWVKKLPKWQRPRIVFLENVEEFEDWGPLLENGKRCPVHKGAIFKEFVRAWQALGAVVEWRRRRAWKSGAATIRNRLYMVIRFDGEPIVWPEPTHGNPNDPADAIRIANGELKVWRTAADIIDFSIPCPSIFDTSAEIKAKLGIRANRPLAENTMARVAKGTMRYVVNSAKPYLVKVNHTGRDEPRDRGLDAPLPAMTGKRDDALVTPFVTKFQSGSTGHPLDEPVHTITAHSSETHGGGAAPMGIVAPYLVRTAHGAVDANGKKRGSGEHTAEEPLPTVLATNDSAVVAPVLVNVANGQTTGRSPNTWPIDEPTRTITGAGGQAVVAPILVGCGGRAAQSEPRPGDEPILTQTAKADLCVVSPFLVPRYGERAGQEPRTRPVDEPAPVIVPTGNEGSLAAVHLQRQFGASVGSDVEEPAGTVTAGGAGKTAVVAAFLAQHNYMEPGHAADEPVSTIIGKGCTQGVVVAHMLNMRGSDRRDAPADEPLRTISSEGNHAATVYAFLAKYFGTGLPSQPVDEPLHTVSTKPRHGLVTVTVDGTVYAIVDIGMRMLTPRERFNAQGFRPDYIIDRGILEDGSTIRFTLEQQGYMCGNSVCPSEAKALVGANYTPRKRKRPGRRPAEMPLFLEAAE